MLYLKDLLRIADDDTKIIITDVHRPLRDSVMFDGYVDEARDIIREDMIVIDLGVVDEEMHILVRKLPIEVTI